jgi:hypothetical protein
MSLMREVGTAQNVGFAFGRMQAEVMADLAQGMVATLDGAGADRDLGAGPSKDYMTVTVTMSNPGVVRVSFTGYAFAKSSAEGTITPGCPCLARGELRVNDEAKQIVTRTVLATDGNDIAADPNANPAVAAADRRNVAGSHVFAVPAGTHTFVMSLTREVGTAQNVGFAFGRIQAEVLAAAPATAPAPPAPPTPPAPPLPTMPNTGGGAGEMNSVAQPWLPAIALGLVVAMVSAATTLRRRSR